MLIDGFDHPLAVTPAADAPAVLDGRYRLTATLKDRPGRIGVYLAVDEPTGRRVKIKWRPAGASDRWERREVEVLAALDHPRVPRSIASFAFEGGVGYVQTYFDGATPRDLARQLGRLEPHAVYAVMASVLEIFTHLHELEVPVIHRDVNPNNLVCLADGEIALIDFGIARIGMRNKHAECVHDLTSAHTMGFAPPEQVIGLEAAPTADLYGLGATALNLLSGEHPSRLWDAASGRLVPPPGLEPRLAAYLAWLTAPAVADRCPSARDALTAMAGLPD